MHDHANRATIPLVFVGGSLLGLAIGATLGVMFAPAKGARTRRQLARKAEELGERATHVAESAREALECGRLIA